MRTWPEVGVNLTDWSRENFDALPLDQRESIVRCLEALLSEMSFGDVRAIAATRTGPARKHWLVDHHHGWGTVVRNHLRTHGWPDDRLMDIGYGPALVRNWDDYYIGALDATFEKLGL